MTRKYRDYRDYLKERGIPFGKPWVTRPGCDSGSNPKGENPERSGGVEGEALQSGAAKTAHRPTSSNIIPIKKVSHHV